MYLVNRSFTGYRMVRIFALSLIILATHALGAIAQEKSSVEVIEMSILYHDPLGKWESLNTTFEIQQLNPKRTEQSFRTVVMNRPSNYFKLIQKMGDEVIEREVNGDQCNNRYNGSENISEEVQEKYRMDCDRAKMYRDYFSYLYGMPMKLRDEGTIIDPVAKEASFNGRECYSVRVTYEQGVGDDIWYFFFDKSNYALVGYKFYHDESKNDGEYITLYGEEMVEGIRIPKNRFWYYNSNDGFLGADFLLAHSAKNESVDLNSEDYNRAASLQWNRVINKKVFREIVQPQWFADSTGFWFHYYNPKGRSFKKYTFQAMRSEPLFDHARMTLALNDLSGDSLDQHNLPLSRLEYQSNGSIRFNFHGKNYEVDLDSYDIDETPVEEEDSPLESMSPDGKWVAFRKDYNLYVRNTENDQEYQLSHDGSDDYQYASYYGWFDIMHGENSERPENFYVNWSPDSKFLQVNICDTRYAEKMYMLDWSVDTLFRPRLLSYYRGSPGDTTLVHYIPEFFSIDSLERIEHPLERHTHINTIDYEWSGQKGQVYARIPSRGYQREELIKLDLLTGKSELLIQEESTTNIDNFSVDYYEDLGRILFLSERSGWRHIYQYDIESRQTHHVTKGDFFVHRIVRVDEEDRVRFFLASGKEENQNPYWQSLYKINLDGKDLTLLTPEAAHHEVRISPDGRYFVDNMSSVGNPTFTLLRDAVDGNELDRISSADARMLFEEGWVPPQTFQAIGRDGVTKIYGALWKPTDFNPNRSYPIIDHSYTGPHTQMFPKSFASGLWRSNQALAELGFVVIMVDGMGSSGRSKDFHNVSYKNMGKNLLDHVLAIRQLGQRFSWIDTTRVGIFGHSAGGFDAGHGLLEFPDFYKVGVASSADHDFRMEKAWWPEMYMGWPVDSTYHEVSNITMAHKLKGKLLIVHGALDDNVNASASFKLAEALIDADKQFDFLILPSQRHGYSDPRHRRFFIKKRWNYFVEHLLGKKPIWDFDL